MKKNQIKEFRNKTKEEIRQEIAELKQKLSKTRLEVKVGKIRNVRIIRNLRRDIAQALTILKEKSFEEEKNLAAKGGEK